MLQEFIVTHRQELIKRAQQRVGTRPAPPVTSNELSNGVPLFLTQLGDILERDSLGSQASNAAMQATATKHGRDLLDQGFTISQVVHDYGDVCQAITELAIELRTAIAAEDFKTLNRCLDDAIASAVTEYSRLRKADVPPAGPPAAESAAQDLRDCLNTALLVFEAVKSGRVGTSGSTIVLLERSLRSALESSDRTLSEERLATGIHKKERIRVDELIHEIQLDTAFDARDRSLEFTVEPILADLLIEADRQLFTAALSTILHNAFRFATTSSTIRLAVDSTPARVVMDVEGDFGGLQSAGIEALFQPAGPTGARRAGRVLGLTVSRRAIESDGGTVTLHDLPDRRCGFTIDMPRATAAPVAPPEPAA